MPILLKLFRVAGAQNLKIQKKIIFLPANSGLAKQQKKLGLIDGIGNAEQILREKFGEKVIIKKFEKQKSFISKKLSSSIDYNIESFINILEERAIWQRFGL